MKNKQYEPYYQNDVNESGGYVEGEKTQQPKNDQNCGNNPKHVVVSLAVKCSNAAQKTH
jgi:hypothetical protein